MQRTSREYYTFTKRERQIAIESGMRYVQTIYAKKLLDLCLRRISEPKGLEIYEKLRPFTASSKVYGFSTTTGKWPALINS